MGLRIRLVEPRPAGLNVYSRVLLPRLGLPLMGAMLTAKGHDVRIYCEVLGQIDLADLLSADLVGISSTTATAPAAYRLAEVLGSAGVAVVLGGPHVSFCSDEALLYAPYVVRGEGEQTMLELVDCLEKGEPVSGLPGLSYRDQDCEPHHAPDRPRCTQAQFELLPIPRLSLIEGHERMTTRPLMTQWGCPFDCEFCSVTAMFSRAVRYRRTEQVLAELASLGADGVFFYDDNFVVNKARTTELLRSMLEAGLTPGWCAQVRADVALRSLSRPDLDHEFLALMHASGCQMVMIGIEAISDEALKAVGKRLQVSTVERAIGAFHDHDIAVHGMFVSGLDTDTAADPGRTASFARRLGIDTFQLMIETPLPGTKLWDRIYANNRLLSNDWSLFDGHHVVMAPAQMTALELQLGVLDAMRRFYSWPRIFASGLTSILSHLPDFTLAARPALLRQLPALVRAARARHFDDMAPLLKLALPPPVLARIGSALWLPALRLYARSQLVTWLEQSRSREHLDFLASLT
ncbi:MAG: B12-binding domain-containing radical SAM protein [Actinobacteria bacterium]|nr:B12-binding domain-containing radical SAM protein [Actinomycetota bacterium]